MYLWICQPFEHSSLAVNLKIRVYKDRANTALAASYTVSAGGDFDQFCSVMHWVSSLSLWLECITSQKWNCSANAKMLNLSKHIRKNPEKQKCWHSYESHFLQILSQLSQFKTLGSNKTIKSCALPARWMVCLHFSRQWLSRHWLQLSALICKKPKAFSRTSRCEPFGEKSSVLDCHWCYNFAVQL